MRSMSLSTLILSVFLLVPSAFSYIFEEVSVQASDPLPYPTIGLFTQPSPFSSAGYPSTEFSYFAGSYVKHLEAAGATVIPIQWDLPYDELDVLLGKINGILFPGGGSTLVNSTTETPSIFTQAGMHIIEKAIEFNKNGDYFPVWATCLGYELLVLSMSGNMTLLIDISDGDDVAKTLNVTQEGLNGLYAEMPADLLNATETANVSYFHHKHTPDPNAFTNDTNLATNFTVAAWTASSIGQYAASIQGTTFPFMGSQFHPEKNTFEWFSTTQVPHSLDAIRTEQYYTYYFINMTLKNKHSFSSIDDLQKSWLYNYQPKHFGPNPEFEEVYVFENYQTYDKSVKLISEYPEGFGPSSDDSDSTDKDISEDEVFRFKEGTPFLFTEEAMAKWH